MECICDGSQVSNVITTPQIITFNTETKENKSVNFGTYGVGNVNYTFNLELLTENVAKVGVKCGRWSMWYNGENHWTFDNIELTSSNPVQTITNTFDSPNYKIFNSAIYIVNDLTI